MGVFEYEAFAKVRKAVSERFTPRTDDLYDLFPLQHYSSAQYMM